MGRDSVHPLGRALPAYLWPEQTDRGATMSEGYRRAADVLVQHVQAAGRSTDFLVHPIVFLYRHHVELQLKEIIWRSARLLGCGARGRRHDLAKLWNEARRLMEEIVGEQSCFEELEHLVAELAKADPRSTAFRYPDEPPRCGDDHWFHIDDFAVACQRAADLLDCAVSELDRLGLTRDGAS